MKKNLTTITLILTIIAFFSLGCGTLINIINPRPVNDEQLNKDLSVLAGGMPDSLGQSIPKDSIRSRCFSIETWNFKGDSGEIGLEMITSTTNSKIYGLGKVAITYKKDGDKWTAQKITPKTGYLVWNVSSKSDTDFINSNSDRICSKGTTVK